MAKFIQIETGTDNSLYALDADGRVYNYEWETDQWVGLSYVRQEFEPCEI